MNTTPLLINFFKIRSILAIHSNLPWTFFHLMPGNYFKKIIIKKIMEYSIYNSQKLIVDSNFANKEIKRILGLKHKDINTINLGIDNKFYKKTNYNYLDNFNYKQDYILSVMSCVKYHNILNILMAIKEITKKYKKKITLVLVLQILDEKYLEILTSYIKKNNLEKNIIIFKNLKSEYLANFYKNAKIYIFSSYSEVFGYTTLEAMACGCPVLVSRTSCLPEINDQAAIYFDPDSINSIKKNILVLWNGKKLRHKLINKGYIHVKKFNTKKSFENTLKVINS
jgi:glycosyltransferase involved in cell wall biosynthesis